MFFIRRLCRAAFLPVLLLVLLHQATPCRAAIFTVSKTADTNDGTCNADCSLREAIASANASAGPDTINFAIGSGAQTINVLSELDAITETVTIDGTSQPGFTSAPLIQLTGPGAGSANGLTINADNCLVRGLVLNGFGAGIVITGMAGNPIAQGNVVAGCYIGTNASGTAIAAVPNGYGILIFDNSNVAGSGAQGNTIGGLTASDRNVVSGNSSHTGIIIGGSVTSGNLIEGNYIGTNAAGTAAVPNSYVGGIWILSPNNVVGGTTANARNIISGNSNGVFLGGANAHDNLVQGNYIGTNAGGTAALGNGSGIVIGDDTQNPNSGAHDNIIGGSAAGAGNLISGNTAGLSISNRFTADNTTGNVVQGNRIGTNAAGTGAVANTNGVVINGGAKNNSIGGTTAGAGNLIAFNTADGVNVGIDAGLTPSGNSIRGNAIHSNGGLGINLQPSGEANSTVTPNDALDADTGPNTVQNFPVITAVVPGASTTLVTGTLSSTANQTFGLDFFASAGADASGNGEGQTYLGAPVSGSATVTTNAGGTANFSVTLSGNRINQFLTATATSSTNDTSEFGPAIKATRTLAISDVTVMEGNSGTRNANFTVTLSPASTQTVTVKYQTSTPGSVAATADVDYIAVPLTTLTFAPGETSKTVTVLVNGDTLDEVNERFAVDLSQAANATIADKEGFGTINDDDAAPSLAVNNVTVTEGNNGTTPATFTVTLSAVSGKTVTVQYNTATPGSVPATAGVDYTAIPTTTLTFAPGETTKQITVPVNGDTLDEDNERFTFNLKNAGNASISDSEGFGTINDDDTAPSLSINDVSQPEGNSGSTAFTFTVTLSAPSGRTVKVSYQTTNPGSLIATPGTDYTAVPLTTLTFAPGETTKQVTVLVNGDTTVEGSERFVVKLSSSANATISDSEGFGTITNDDVAAPLLFEQDEPSE